MTLATLLSYPIFGIIPPMQRQKIISVFANEIFHQIHQVFWSEKDQRLRKFLHFRNDRLFTNVIIKMKNDSLKLKVSFRKLGKMGKIVIVVFVYLRPSVSSDTS